MKNGTILASLESMKCRLPRCQRVRKPEISAPKGTKCQSNFLVGSTKSQRSQGSGSVGFPSQTPLAIHFCLGKISISLHKELRISYAFNVLEFGNAEGHS